VYCLFMSFVADQDGKGIRKDGTGRMGSCTEEFAQWPSFLGKASRQVFQRTDRVKWARAKRKESMSRKVIKAIFGRIALHRGYCPDCHDYALIINGLLQCCDREFGEQPRNERIKRESEPGEKTRGRLSKSMRIKILDRQDYKCVYCGISLREYRIFDARKDRFVRLRIHMDHFVPWAYSQDTRQDTMYASCNLCNMIKHDMVFKDLISAREFILRKRNICQDSSSDSGTQPASTGR